MDNKLLLNFFLLVLMVLFYISNRQNRTNKWAAFAVFVFGFGVFKETFYHDLVPLLKEFFGERIAFSVYDDIYSVLTWFFYCFSMPMAVIFSMYFRDLNTRRKLIFHLHIIDMFIMIIMLSIFFPPLQFRELQISGNKAFWITFTVYNIILGISYIAFLITGILVQKDRRIKLQKILVSIIVIPPVVYWLISIFIVHSFNLSRYFDLWQGNVIVVLLSITAYIIVAFRTGMMGLKLTGTTYQWNSDLSMVRKSAEFTGHMLKNQTTKMEWCIENLKNQMGTSHNIPEELNILSRSIENIKLYADRTRKQSEIILLEEKICSLKELIELSLPTDDKIDVAMSLHEPDISILCDRTHLTEVFHNIINNACEAMLHGGRLNIISELSGRILLIYFTDNGIGIDEAEIEKIFTPYYTTKNPDKNFGLGLSYCVNVIRKHGGFIRAERAPENGTTIIVGLPAGRIIKNKKIGDRNEKNQSVPC